MQSIRKYLSLFIMSLCLFGFTKEPAVIPIKKFKEIENLHLTPNTLVLLDIDNTTLRAKSHYGSAEFFSHMIAEEKEKHNYTRAQAIIKIYDRWIKSQEAVETKLIDEELHKFIERVREAGATLIAFTARQPVIAVITKAQLDKHQIYPDELLGFQFEKQYKTQIFPDDEWCGRKHNKGICEGNVEKLYHDVDSVFYKGILFAHDLVKKGKVFQEFYEEYILYLKGKNLPLPKKILFVDDGMRNLVSVEETVRHLGLEFQGFHIADDFKYDPVVSKLEESALVQD